MLRREKPGSSGFDRMIRAAAGEEHAWRREIHFDHVGNIDGRDIGPVVLNPGIGSRTAVSSCASSGLSAYLLKNFASSLGLVRL